MDSLFRQVAPFVVFAVERQAGVRAEARPPWMHKRHANNLAVLAWRFVSS